MSAATPLFTAYIRAERLTDEVRARNGMKPAGKTPRFDVAEMAGYYKPLEALRLKNGMLYFYLNNTAYTTSTTNNPARRRADRSLQVKDSLNFSSVYLLETPAADGSIIGYGNPYGAATFGKDRKPNPFAGCSNDGFLFIIAPDYSQIEILVIPNGLFTMLGNAQALCDGRYNEALEAMRNNARPYYEY